LVGNDQAALRVKAHADPGAFGTWDAVEELDAKVFFDLDLVDRRGLRGVAVIDGDKVAAASFFGLLLGGGRGDGQHSGEQDESEAGERGFHEGRKFGGRGVLGGITAGNLQSTEY
jgi:hypothetical protein